MDRWIGWRESSYEVGYAWQQVRGCLAETVSPLHLKSEKLVPYIPDSDYGGNRPSEIL